jgi:hypothetical protein
MNLKFSMPFMSGLISFARLRLPGVHGRVWDLTPDLRAPRAVRQNVELELQYKSCYARILDSKRRFLEAATRYYELSQVGGRGSDGAQVRPRWMGT